MMFPPSLLRIYIAGDRRHRINLWLPLILLWPFVLLLGLLLAPLLLLLALFTWPRFGRTLLLAAPRLVTLICALRGLRIQVGSGREQFYLYFI